MGSREAFDGCIGMKWEVVVVFSHRVSDCYRLVKDFIGGNITLEDMFRLLTGMYIAEILEIKNVKSMGKY